MNIANWDEEDDEFTLTVGPFEAHVMSDGDGYCWSITINAESYSCGGTDLLLTAFTEAQESIKKRLAEWAEIADGNRAFESDKV